MGGRARHGFAYHAQIRGARENFDITALPEDALDEINRIQTRQRLNEVVKSGVRVSSHEVDEKPPMGVRVDVISQKPENLTGRGRSVPGRHRGAGPGASGRAAATAPQWAAALDQIQQSASVTNSARTGFSSA